jgi:hypothetical protein
MLQEASDADAFKDADSTIAAKVGELIAFYSDKKNTNNDEKWIKKRDGDLKDVVNAVKASAPDTYEKYFGKVPFPTDFVPVLTDQANSLQMSNQQITVSYAGGGTGDPVGDERATGKGAPVKGVGPGNRSWDKLDNRMKQRIQKLMAASGGKVWVGQGWRDPAEQGGVPQAVLPRRWRPHVAGQEVEEASRRRPARLTRPLEPRDRTGRRPPG